MITVACLKCTNEFGYEPLMFHGREFFGRKYCDPCVDDHQCVQAEMAAQKRSGTLACEWAGICPPIYQDTDPARLMPKMRQYGETWVSENGRGLAFVGPTGKCKTRLNAFTCCFSMTLAKSASPIVPAASFSASSSKEPLINAPPYGRATLTPGRSSRPLAQIAANQRSAACASSAR